MSPSIEGQGTAEHHTCPHSVACAVSPQPLNPATNATFDLIQGLLAEVGRRSQLRALRLADGLVGAQLMRCRHHLKHYLMVSPDHPSPLPFQVTEGGSVRGGLFPDDFFHLGGDEVDPTCWAVTPQVEQWMMVREAAAAHHQH